MAYDDTDNEWCKFSDRLIIEQSEMEKLESKLADLQAEVERLTEKLEDALFEIAESHSTEDEEADGISCFVVNCNCSFCEDFRKQKKGGE